jgi:hypothetical protein
VLPQYSRSVLEQNQIHMPELGLHSQLVIWVRAINERDPRVRDDFDVCVYWRRSLLQLTSEHVRPRIIYAASE